MFRLSKKWLRFQVLSKVRSDHPDLFFPFWSEKLKKIKQFVISKNSWWFILLVVILFFSVGGVINIEAFNIIDVNSSTAKILVDQRAGNIAAITAITLVVVGFLINNIAVKEAYAFRLLFKHSFLYPIIYLTLSTIGCFFIVSTLRDAIEPWRFVNIVLAGTYLAVIILFVIGFLFKTITDFTNDNTIRKLLHDELIFEMSQILKVILLKRCSNEIYKKLLSEYDAKEFDWREELELKSFNVTSNDLFSEDEKKQVYIHDINLKKLRVFLSMKKNASSEMLYQQMTLLEIVKDYDDYVWLKNMPNTANDKKYLRWSIIVRNVDAPSDDKESVRKYFDQKLEMYSNASDYKGLEVLLESYYELYNLQIKHQ